jgi:ferredoxin
MPSVRVRFEPSGVELVLAAGERLLDASDEHAAPALLPLACRAGNCGACLLHVRAGAARLTAPTSAERAVLRELAAGPDERLGCQVHAAGDLAGEAADAVVIVVAATRLESR